MQRANDRRATLVIRIGRTQDSRQRAVAVMHIQVSASASCPTKGLHQVIQSMRQQCHELSSLLLLLLLHTKHSDFLKKLTSFFSFSGLNM